MCIFLRKNSVNKLVFYEWYDDIKLAIEREKEIKGWKKKRMNWLNDRTQCGKT